MKKIRIIVPSWSELSVDMQAETGSKYAAFIQLGGIPLYLHILRLYEKIINDHEIEFVFVLSSSAPEIQLSQVEGFKVNVIRLTESRSIGDTVLGAITSNGDADAIIVHMADTIIDSTSLDELDVIYIQKRTDLYRWTSIERGPLGSIRVIHDRDHRSAGIEQSVCVGVFAFSDGSYFSGQLNEAVKYSSSEVDPFFVAVESYSQKYSLELIEPNYWYDCGHIDSFYESRLNFNNLRHFNSLLYDSVSGKVTKRSKNSESFRHQVRWFKQAPDELSPFLPRIYESSDGESPYITMELLSMPTLGELFINQRLDLGAWNDVAKKIKYIQSLLQKHAFKSPVNTKIAHAIYIEKTKLRIQEFIDQRPEVAEFWVSQNGKRLSLLDVILTLDKYVTHLNILSTKILTPIHGDMCFSNLLYDSRGRHIKLIDPRGEFGLPGIYGDPRYDKAKLLHSYSGGYDFITSDQFDVEVKASGALCCSIGFDDYHKKVRQIFDSTLFSEEQEHRECDAIQALLFLSMLPLHADKPNRQLAMLFTGLTIYANNFFEVGVI